MKQYITIKQASDELDKKAYNQLALWLKDHGYILSWKNKPNDLVKHTKNKAGDFVFMNVGQMIEFLAEKGDLFSVHSIFVSVFRMRGLVGEQYPESMNFKNLCDNLWDEVKEILEKENE